MRYRRIYVRHGDDSPVLGWRDFCSRGLEQPTSAMRQLLLLVQLNPGERGLEARHQSVPVVENLDDEVAIFIEECLNRHRPGLAAEIRVQDDIAQRLTDREPHCVANLGTCSQIPSMTPDGGTQRRELFGSRDRVYLKPSSRQRTISRPA